MINIKDTIEKYNDDHCKFEKVKNKLNNRPDLHAFLLLDKLLPENKNMISAVSYDIIYLNIDIKELSKKITEEQVHELVCCGIMYESSYDCLSKFV